MRSDKSQEKNQIDNQAIRLKDPGRRSRQNKSGKKSVNHILSKGRPKKALRIQEVGKLAYLGTCLNTAFE